MSDNLNTNIGNITVKHVESSGFKQLYSIPCTEIESLETMKSHERGETGL